MDAKDYQKVTSWNQAAKKEDCDTICPILTDDIFDPIYCRQERCGFWNKEKQQCGIASR